MFLLFKIEFKIKLIKLFSFIYLAAGPIMCPICLFNGFLYNTADWIAINADIFGPASGPCPANYPKMVQYWTILYGTKCCCQTG